MGVANFYTISRIIYSLNNTGSIKSDKMTVLDRIAVMGVKRNVTAKFFYLATHGPCVSTLIMSIVTPLTL